MDVLTDEMRRYEYAIGASGAITYGAPEGFHDDCVVAVALAKRHAAQPIRDFALIPRHATYTATKLTDTQRGLFS